MSVYGDGILDFAYGGLGGAVDIWKQRERDKAEDRRNRARIEAANTLARFTLEEKRRMYQAVALAGVAALGVVLIVKSRKRKGG